MSNDERHRDQLKEKLTEWFSVYDIEVPNNFFTSDYFECFYVNIIGGSLAYRPVDGTSSGWVDLYGRLPWLDDVGEGKVAVFNNVPFIQSITGYDLLPECTDIIPEARYLAENAVVTKLV